MGELSGNNDALRLACVLSFCIVFSFSFSLVWRRVFVFCKNSFDSPLCWEFLKRGKREGVQSFSV